MPDQLIPESVIKIGQNMQSELQACPTTPRYLERKSQLYDYICDQFIDRKAIYYAVFLLEEARRDSKTGMVRFSENVEKLPEFPRPDTRGEFSVITNDNWRKGDDLKI